MPTIHYPRPGSSQDETTARLNGAPAAVDPAPRTSPDGLMALPERMVRSTGRGVWTEDAEGDGLAATATPMCRKWRLPQAKAIVVTVRYRAALDPQDARKG